ncbi:MAG: hypothetical protein AAGF11_31695 [Myxococcota bacterium]
MALALATPAHAGEPTAPSALSLQMRSRPDDTPRDEAQESAEPTTDADESSRDSDESAPVEDMEPLEDGAPDEARDEAQDPGDDAPETSDAASPEGSQALGEGDALQEVADSTTAGEGNAPTPPESVTPTVPPPSSVRDVPEHVTVAVGLGPQAPGTREERALLGVLETGLAASSDPTSEVRRLRPGRGARRVCRERRDDLVVMIGYIADRPTPVVLAHDCSLDRALGIRPAEAARDPGLLDALWEEHRALMREGVRPRRRISLSPRARGGIIAGVAIVVVGVAVGALVANALRKETVVITVRP